MSTNPAGLLPGVPLVESPFFSDIFPDDYADPEILRLARDLNRDGYAVFSFPDPEFDRLADEIKRSLHDHYEWSTWPNKGSLRVADAWKFEPNVRRIATNEAVLALLGTLFGRKAWPFQTLNFPVGTQQHLHTDIVHFSSVPERFMCGVWVALEDIDETNGPLVYVPGSHKWPVFVNEHIGVDTRGQGLSTTQVIYEPLWAALVRKSGLPTQRFQARKGQALIWLANLLHGGAPHLDRKRTRWSQVTHYYFEDCAYYTPMYSNPICGQVVFRSLTDVRTGAGVEHRYLGSAVPDEYIEFGSANLPPGFDPTRYLELNPDVATAGIDPTAHYLRSGFKERRRYK